VPISYSCNINFGLMHGVAEVSARGCHGYDHLLLIGYWLGHILDAAVICGWPQRRCVARFEPFCVYGASNSRSEEHRSPRLANGLGIAYSGQKVLWQCYGRGRTASRRVRFDNLLRVAGRFIGVGVGTASAAAHWARSKSRCSGRKSTRARRFSALVSMLLSMNTSRIATSKSHIRPSLVWQPFYAISEALRNGSAVAEMAP
jgi:hypothetical protein